MKTIIMLMLLGLGVTANAQLPEDELKMVEEVCDIGPGLWVQIHPGRFLRCYDSKVFVMLQRDPIGFVDGSGLLFTKKEVNERTK